MKWFILWTIWAARLVRQPTLPVKISGGYLSGVIAPDGSHRQYSGIPFASVPQRFKAPGPEPKWDGVYEAIHEHIRCQQNFEKYIIMGQEECLTLNVYTPLNLPESPLPVMVFFHGGGFYQGSSSAVLYGPKYLVNKGVILVAVNYRLNIQGFLCLRTKDAPGNAGMKDQVAALKWVQRNIKAFGGDPDQVTIFGESAGGASVSLHLTSKMSKGLFHRAIIQSGSSFGPWAVQYRPVYMAGLLAKTMGYNVEDADELYKLFMSKTDSELIFTRVPRKPGNNIISELLYTPCVEKEIEGEEAFLTELSYDLFSRGDFTKVPIMIGSNCNEGQFFAALENDTALAQMSFDKMIPKDLVIPPELTKSVAEKLQQIYMQDDLISKKNILKVSKLHGEPNFNVPALEETSLILKNSDKPVYSYMFKYVGRRNIAKRAAGKVFAESPGASHADELFYLFSQDILPSFFECRMIEFMTTLWTNFAKYGNPTPAAAGLPVNWNAANKNDPLSFVINEQTSVQPLWYSESVLYWKELYTKYRRKTI